MRSCQTGGTASKGGFRFRSIFLDREGTSGSCRRPRMIPSSSRLRSNARRLANSRTAPSENRISRTHILLHMRLRFVKRLLFDGLASFCVFASTVKSNKKHYTIENIS